MIYAYTDKYKDDKGPRCLSFTALVANCSSSMNRVRADAGTSSLSSMWSRRNCTNLVFSGQVSIKEQIRSQKYDVAKCIFILFGASQVMKSQIRRLRKAHKVWYPMHSKNHHLASARIKTCLVKSFPLILKLQSRSCGAV